MKIQWFCKFFCVCFPLPLAFIYIRFAELIRLIWEVIFELILVSNSSTQIGDYIFDGLAFVFDLILSGWSLKSLGTGYEKADLPIHRKYLFFKLTFIFLNGIKLLIKPKYDCLSENNDCLEKYLNASQIFDFLWTLLEIYFLSVSFVFYCQVKKKVYAIDGGTILFMGDQNMCLRAIDVETKGKKTIIEEIYEIGCPIYQKNEKKDKIKKLKTKKIFIAPFPLSVLKKKKIKRCSSINIKLLS